MNSNILVVLDQLVDHPIIDFQIEAFWIIANLATGSEQITKVLISNNYIEKAIQKLDCQDIQLIDQCVWFLGNMAIDNVQNRNQMLNLNVHLKIANIIS